MIVQLVSSNGIRFFDTPDLYPVIRIPMPSRLRCDPVGITDITDTRGNTYAAIQTTPPQRIDYPVREFRRVSDSTYVERER